MGNLYENLLSLCDEKGITGAKMCTDIGISKSLMTGLKKKRREGITTDTAQKIADYFGVSVDRVLGTEQKEKADSPKGTGLSEIDIIFSQLTPSRQAKLIELARLYLDDQRRSEET